MQSGAFAALVLARIVSNLINTGKQRKDGKGFNIKTSRHVRKWWISQKYTFRHTGLTEIKPKPVSHAKSTHNESNHTA